MEETYEELKAKNVELESKLLRQQVAFKTGLPIDLAQRLVGNDEESMMADAENMLSLMKPKQTIPPLKDNEPKLKSNGGYNQLLNRIGRD